MVYFQLLLIGLCAGVLSGMFGIGGGIVIVPALIFMMKMTQLQAMGTSLAALIPPVGLLGAMEYYRNGYINIMYALLIACGLFFGAYFGAKIIVSISPIMVKRCYAVFLVLVGVRMMFK